MNVFRNRCGAIAVGAVATAIAIAGCGSSSPNNASVTLKPVEAMGSMSASEMKHMAPMKAESGMLLAPSNAHGTVSLTQKGDQLTGLIKVWGLVPNSRHAEHLHGPDGACSPGSKMTPNMAVVLPDLVANAKGEATQKISLTVHQDVVENGYFIMVHQKPTPPSERNQIGSAPASPAFMQALSNDPGILCGDVKTS
ncbi:MAG: hypothetical protein WB507_08870 [Solirubrobacterales bacterium]